MSRAVRLLLLLVAAVTSGSCDEPVPADGASVSIMTFNVQNLFDTEDDPATEDRTFLPLAAKQTAAHRSACGEIEVAAWREECLVLDWTEDLLEVKLAALGRAIRQVDGGPDIIAFQEVENAAVLERLRDTQLPGLGYGPAILIEGQDHRGIDVAFLSKLPLAGEPVLHPLAFPQFPERQGDTRGVLEATFILPDGNRLTGFAVHFPAPFHPIGMRRHAYRHLAALRARLPEEDNAFAAGDFNTTRDEAAGTDILETLARPYWTLAHETGCAGCRGTYYYARDDAWSFLDMIFYSPARSEKTTWRLRANAARIPNETAGQKNADGTPRRFFAADGTGVSDHWPLLVVIESATEQ